MINDKAIHFRNHFNERLLPILRDEVYHVIQRSPIITHTWTNNNSECTNHVLKSLIDWKSQPLHKFVDMMIKMINQQSKDLQRAMIGLGEYSLFSQFNKFLISQHAYSGKSESERNRLFNKFLKAPIIDPRHITSSNGYLTVKASPSAGKKPFQRKRKNNERTWLGQKVQRFNFI
ncbi:MAG: hypothetical protein V2I33_23830 [Kangiellaceae bacterium]|nr:hypothetical protein [Kangiellaceae bacterium]